MRKIELYDTTLRDGTQRAGVSLSVDDKLKVLHGLDRLGVAYIEGGWPGSNPKDAEFFERSKDVLLETSVLTAFGMTRRPGIECDDDPNLHSLLESGATVACIVGKSSTRQVTEVVRTTLEENLAMVGDSVSWLKAHGLRVFFDAEHFFDGYKTDRDYATQVLRSAARAGAEVVVLCDTNGATLPAEVERIVEDAVSAVECRLGAHFHDDSACGVANSLAAVVAGADHVQGCVNGYGERCGNADILSIAANLELKLGMQALPPGRMERLAETSHYVAEVFNISPNAHQPFVGHSAFAHKGGLHVSAVVRDPRSYEHIDPDSVGNSRRLMASDLSGAATLRARAESLGLQMTDEQIRNALDRLKQLEFDGYSFEAADGSLHLLLMEAMGWKQDYFEPLGFRAIVEESIQGRPTAEATVRILARGERKVAAAEGQGPVDALDKALRSALAPLYPEIETFHLTDYKVRVLDPEHATAAKVRVLVETSDAQDSWATVGVSENIIEASWRALVDSVVMGLVRCDALAPA